jgi:hypothetical protein
MFQFPAFASKDLWIQSKDSDLAATGFPHSEIAGSQGGCPLPDAYRRLQRPSSPPAAKASTVCACSLDHIPKPFPVPMTLVRATCFFSSCSSLYLRRIHIHTYA